MLCLCVSRQCHTPKKVNRGDFSFLAINLIFGDRFPKLKCTSRNRIVTTQRQVGRWVVSYPLRPSPPPPSLPPRALLRLFGWKNTQKSSVSSDNQCINPMTPVQRNLCHTLGMRQPFLTGASEHTKELLSFVNLRSPPPADANEDHA